MKIAKEFRWEMGHRLPDHEGLCRNVHGHSYKMSVEVTGELNANGMVVDFFELGEIVNPILDRYDHSFLCSENDKPMAEFLRSNDMKRVFVDYPTTVENICNDFTEQIGGQMKR